ncbi:cytochrome C biogenesis protein CcmC [Iodidimonas gelatinilytica]|uniref:Heme exporter protein C n=1 Tax=Iodidimonas gelatinilytica TaxID=1236966 RepID=A0A5A7MYA6_9PROT|nr:heme ABC transporter permease [Iodidimonas gelatinilytica]GEQ97704.1 cytochrome C biogenesis protein CcmC [Iodidimonas gelatinilytica]GER00972.1 cytochrome C biogenesis protein CcmC [Iodidimonas gelatinilytica]
MHWFANPARFIRLADKILPLTLPLTVGLLAVGLYLALVASPADYQQGDTVRIMYIHVPSAYMALFCYMVVAAAGFSTLVWRHPLADVAGKAAAPIGLAFTGLALVTGSLWGKPMWGAWWVWDARLTSVLVLFFLYLGYMAIWGAFEDRSKAARAAAILALVGVINIPIIKFSVDWWTTLHQPASLFRADGPSIDPSMRPPLYVMLAAFQFYFFTVFLWRIKGELAAIRLNALRYAGEAPRSASPKEEQP